MQSIVSVSPFRCRMWSFHARLEAHVTEETCKEEIASFTRHGQLVPVLGRPIQGDPDYDVELIYGARRLFAARHINKPLRVELRNVSDKEAIVAMDIENRQRLDISPYERGQSYALWLREGYFSSQDEIARALRVSASQISRLLKLTRLPNVVVRAFDSPLSICEGWGLDLLEVLENPEKRMLLLRRARQLAESQERPPARDTYGELLMAAAGARKARKRRPTEVVKGDDGAPLFSIKYQGTTVALVLPVTRASRELLDNICGVVAGMLGRSVHENPELGRRLAGLEAERAAAVHRFAERDVVMSVAAGG